MQDASSKSQARGNLWAWGKKTRLPADRGSTGWTCALREVPLPSGAQMTRRMACTQSSISRWELAMSSSASGFAGTFSCSPAPPARQREEAYCSVPVQDSRSLLTPGSSALDASLYPVSLYMSALSGISLSAVALTFVASICSFVSTSKGKSLKASQDTTRGKMAILGQLRSSVPTATSLCFA